MTPNTTSNTTEATMDKDNSKDKIVIAIILPSIFAILLVLLIATAFLLPKLTTETPESREERRQKRLAKLDKNVKAQHFADWASKQRNEHPEMPVSMHPLCVICLDEIEDAAQIRGLGCLHVFHQECLDDWFSRWNEYCPLCHRPIVKTAKEARASEDPQRPQDTGLLPLPMMV